MSESPKAAPVRRRQQQRSIDTRLKIVRAALSQFAMLGFDGASTRGIALAADVPHSLVLHHYKSKDELWRETVAEVATWYAEGLFHHEDAAADQPAVEQIRTFFTHYIRFSAAHPDFFRMITQENMLNSERIRWLVEHHTGKVARRMAGLITRAQADGRFVEGDAMQLLYVFLGAATSPYRSAAELAQVTGRSPSEPDQIERHIAICLKLFLRD